MFYPFAYAPPNCYGNILLPLLKSPTGRLHTRQPYACHQICQEALVRNRKSSHAHTRTHKFHTLADMQTDMHTLSLRGTSSST